MNVVMKPTADDVKEFWRQSKILNWQVCKRQKLGGETPISDQGLSFLCENRKSSLNNTDLCVPLYQRRIDIGTSKLVDLALGDKRAELAPFLIHS